MGFEQLAALKRELTARARQQQREEQEKRESQENKGKRQRPVSKKGPKNTEPVDPVVITISRLQRLFPKTFPKKPAPKVPLKLGIHKELHLQSEALKLSPEAITEAVKTWCRGSRYWACMVQDAPRLDLAGEPAGTVTEAEAKFAKMLASRQRASAAKARKAVTAQEPSAAQAAQPDQASAPAQAAPDESGAAQTDQAADRDTPESAPLRRS